MQWRAEKRAAKGAVVLAIPLYLYMEVDMLSKIGIEIQLWMGRWGAFTQGVSQELAPSIHKTAAMHVTD